jgi:hypothetical protein
MRASTPHPTANRVGRLVALPARVGGAAGRPARAPVPTLQPLRTIGDRCALLLKKKEGARVCVKGMRPTTDPARSSG